MAAFNKFQSFVEALAEKKHNLGSDTLKVMLTAAANPPLATDTVKADQVEITAEHGYAAGGATVTITASAQAAGVYKLEGNDVVITAAGGTIGPFRYAILYNDTAANDELIGWWDYLSDITLPDTEPFTVDFNPANGILQIT